MNNDQKFLAGAKTTILDLIRDLRDNIFEEIHEQRDLSTVEFFFSKMHETLVMKHVIQFILPHKNQIENKDLNFFLENTTLFSGLPQNKIDYYTQLITGGQRLDEEDTDLMWDYFRNLVAFGEAYRKYK